MKTKKKMLLLPLIMCLVYVNADVDCSPHKVVLFDGCFANANVHSPNWRPYSSDEDEKAIKCYFHTMKNYDLYNKFRALRDEIFGAKNDIESLKLVRRNVETYLFLSKSYTGKELWPAIPLFGCLRINLYQRLIELDRSKYLAKHDELIEYYTKQILVNWKDFREALIKNKYKGTGYI